MLLNQQRILCFSAHPDDEVGGAGGFLAKAKNQGASLKLSLLTTGAFPQKEKSETEIKKIRLKEFIRVANALEADYSFLDFERYFKFELKNILACIKEIRLFKPLIILVPHQQERHPEHRVSAELIKEAGRIARRKDFPELGRPHQASEIREYELDNPMPKFDLLEDITDFIIVKEKLFNYYNSQLKEKKFLQAILSLNHYRGITKRISDYAEAFKITKII